MKDYTSVDIEAEVACNGQTYLMTFTVCGRVRGGKADDVQFQEDKIDLIDIFDPEDFTPVLVWENLQQNIDNSFRKDD